MGMTSVFEVYKYEIYTLNNLIRLVIVASSISFFLIITCLDLAQLIATTLYQIDYWFKYSILKKDSLKIKTHA